MYNEMRGEMAAERLKRAREKAVAFSSGSRSTKTPPPPLPMPKPLISVSSRKKGPTGEAIGGVGRSNFAKATGQPDRRVTNKTIVDDTEDLPTNRAVPLRAEELLSWICSPDEMEEVLGDFEERFIWVRERRGLPAAQRWYWAQVVKYAAKIGRNLVKKGTLDKIKKGRARK